jgi:predicted alpha-1,6-mannanase (GH76 family)
MAGAGVFDEQTQRMIEAAAAAGAVAALARYVDRPPCGLSAENARELPHLLGCIKDIGGGGDDGLSKGIEVFRKNQAFNMKWRSVCEQTGAYILGAIILSVCGVAGLIIGTGFWGWLKAGLKGIEK